MMQTLARRKPLHYALMFFGGAVLFISLVSWRQIAADGTSDAGKEDADGATSSIGVDVNVPQQLRVAGKHTYSVNVSLTARDDSESVAGPIYLVVEQTGIPGLAADQVDGVTADNEPYYLVLPANKKLVAAAPKISQKIYFKSNEALRSATRRDFKLEYRLTREISRRESQTSARNEKRPRDRRITGIPRGTAGAPRGRSSETSNGNNRPDGDAPGNANGKKSTRREPFTLKQNITDKEVKRVIDLQNDWTPKLLKKEGVVGTATGLNVDGDLVIRVYTSRFGIDRDLPASIGGIAVEPKVVGRFRAMYQPPQDKRGHAGVPGVPSALQPIAIPPDVDDPQGHFPRPVPIGVSGINFSIGGCGTGTIGCRLKGEDGTLYAMSNNHVFADENLAPIGDPILQPGPLDDNCAVNANNSIGTLVAFVPINFSLTGNNQVDVAIARVTAATLSRRTPRGAYGIPNSATVAARLGMKVQKMGRTTGYTTGRVTAVNTVSFVGYDAGVAMFVDQIEISKPIIIIDDATDEITVNLDVFGGPGDSGSLIVTTSGKNPVGLLFAGSVFITIANPIDAVLDAISTRLGQPVSIDGSRSNLTP